MKNTFAGLADVGHLRGVSAVQLFICLAVIVSAGFATSCNRVEVQPETTVAKPVLPLTKARYWEKFDDPPGRSQGVSCLGADCRGDVWMMSGNGTFWWNDAEKKWSSSLLPSGQYLTQLYGSPTTGLYATQRGQKDHWGDVCFLETGTVTRLTQFYYDVAHELPGFHVVGKDRFLNWGGEKLRIFDHGNWIEHPAEIPQKGAFVFETVSNVILYANNKLFRVGADNALTVTEVEADIMSNACKVAAWGSRCALVVKQDVPGVTGLDLYSGRRVDTALINKTLGGRTADDLVSAPDGNVWVMAPAREGLYLLFRVQPDGKTSCVRPEPGIPWASDSRAQAPSRVLVDAHGAVWFAGQHKGIFYLVAGKFTFFDPRMDNSPVSCDVMLQRSNGVIVAGARTGLYAYNNGTSLTESAPVIPIPLTPLPKPDWQYTPSQKNDRLSHAWFIHDFVFFLSSGGEELIGLDLTTGRKRFSIPVERDEADSIWVTSGTNRDELVLYQEKKRSIVDVRTGTMLRSIPCQRDRRIAPVRLDDRVILVKQLDPYKGEVISCVNMSGEEDWRFPLSGSVMTHPALLGSILIVQTRQASYGDQATWGIDALSGAQRWTETVNAYGAGVAFADDARYCVESDTFLSPDRTEAWLISRNPLTGVRLWRYSKAGTTIDHPPLIDTLHDRVYAVFHSGMLVCLDGIGGGVVWETALTQPPSRMMAEVSESCMSIFPDLVAVVTEDQMLYLIQKADGRIRHRIDLKEGLGPLESGALSVIAPPHMAGNRLVVATTGGVKAYPLPVGGDRKPSGSVR